MIIDNISIQNDGYVSCKSNFYSCNDVLVTKREYTFHTGVNKLNGEIDSGIWAISYLLSMYKYVPKKEIILFAPPKIIVNNVELTLEQFSHYSCYMDEKFPLFSTKRSVENVVSSELKKSSLKYTADEIRQIFNISEDRFKCTINAAGNERFKAMAAIGFVSGKQVYCFPWLSNARFSYYHNNLSDLLDILKKLNCIVVLPVGTQENTEDGSVC